MLGFTAVRGLSVDATIAGADGSESAPGAGPIDGPQLAASVAATTPAQRVTDSPNLELCRGVSDDQPLWTWLQDWLAGTVPPQDVRICLLDAQGTPVAGWICNAAVPVRWIGPTLVADQPAVAMETLELAHRGIDRVTDLDTCCEGASD